MLGGEKEEEKAAVFTRGVEEGACGEEVDVSTLTSSKVGLKFECVI